MKLHIGERGVAPLPIPTQTLLKQVVSSALRLHQKYRVINCEINLTFVTETEVTELNKQYRNKDTSTDVLSFPSTGTIPTQNLGDIVICLQVAENQALEYGHSLERELAFLTAHGFLHLIGYDHMTIEEEETMLAMQKQILSRVGV